MLAAEGDEVLHRDCVATALDHRPQELAALGEAEGVDGGRLREHLVRCDVSAYLGYLHSEVAQKRRGAVAACIFV